MYFALLYRLELIRAKKCLFTKKLDVGWGKFTFYQIGNYGIAFSYVTLQIHPSCQEYKRIYACISDLHLSHIHTSRTTRAMVHSAFFTF